MVPGFSGLARAARAALGVLAVSVLAPGTAGAVTLYCVAFGVNSIDCTPSSELPLSSLDVPTGVRATGSAVAGTTGPVSLGVQAVAADTTGFGAAGTARAELSGFEVVISGPTGAMTTTSVNLSVSGSIDPFGGGDINQGVLTLRTILTSSHGTATGNGSFYSGISGGGGPPTIFSGSTGIVQSLYFGGDFATPALSVTSGETVFLSLTLEAQSSCRDSFGSSCGTTTSYLHSLGLRATGPVFNLPAGWTANSPDGSIVNNLLVAAPEPSALALVGLSIAAIRARRFRAS